MRRTVSWVAAPLAALALMIVAGPANGAPARLLAAAPPPPMVAHTGSFAQNTVTVKVSGSRGGIQTGPFTNLVFAESDRGKMLNVRPGRISSLSGEELPGAPLHVYRSLVGSLQPGAQVNAFGDPPIRQAVEVAVERSGDTLAWRIEPGTYFIFVPYTRPIVQVPRGVQPAFASYTVAVE